MTPPPQTSCFACGLPLPSWAERCGSCGVRQPSSPSWTPTVGLGRSRVAAVLLALLLGGLGLHKFYLGRPLAGLIYLVFVWTAIPAFIAWIEAIAYLRTSDVEWAARYGGYPTQANPAAIGCLWVVALLPLVAIGFLLLGLVSVGSGVDPGVDPGQVTLRLLRP